MTERTQWFDSPLIAKSSKRPGSPDPEPVIGILKTPDERTGCPAIPYPVESGNRGSPDFRVRIVERRDKC